MKNKKIIPGLLLSLALLCFPQRAAAAQAGDALVPVGRTVGIELNCRGAVVTGFSDVETEKGTLCPAREAGVLPGDTIISLNGETVENGRAFLEKADRFSGEDVTLLARRGEREVELTVTPEKNAEGTWQLGLWLRDCIHGVGTVTYYDPLTGDFGALGHGVSLPEGERLMEISGGSIMDAEVVDVVAGQKGEPGELCGVADGERVLGSVESNTPRGIFGKAAGALCQREALPVAADSEIRPGKALIVSTVDGTGPREFEAEILRIDFSGADTRQLTIAVTDQALLASTGGIVQGMSGSPILQNGKLVGAVTHVLLNDPSKGYGISMENMLKAAPALAPAA